LGFGFYIGNFSNYNKTYGAIGGVIVMLLWLWILNMSLPFGAEVEYHGNQIHRNHYLRSHLADITGGVQGALTAFPMIYRWQIIRGSSPPSSSMSSKSRPVLFTHHPAPCPRRRQ